MGKSTDEKSESMGFGPGYVQYCWVPLVITVNSWSGWLLYLSNVGLGEVIPKLPSDLPSFTVTIHSEIHVGLRYMGRNTSDDGIGM